MEAMNTDIAEWWVLVVSGCVCAGIVLGGWYGAAAFSIIYCTQD